MRAPREQVGRHPLQPGPVRAAPTSSRIAPAIRLTAWISTSKCLSGSSRPTPPITNASASRPSILRTSVRASASNRNSRASMPFSITSTRSIRQARR
ncbi:hypothetical protein ACFQ9X_50435 [Catenulispora yoronensis]